MVGPRGLVGWRGVVEWRSMVGRRSVVGWRGGKVGWRIIYNMFHVRGGHLTVLHASTQLWPFFLTVA